MSVAVPQSIENQSPVGRISSDVWRSTEGWQFSEVRWQIARPLVHLLWREWRLLSWWFLAAIVFPLTVMFLTALRFSSYFGLGGSYYELVLELSRQSLLAPMVFLVGSLVASFANERDDSSFIWCTTLPLRWRLPFGVKLFCAFGGALLCWLIVLPMEIVIGRLFRPTEDLMILLPAEQVFQYAFYSYFPQTFVYFFAAYLVAMVSIQLARQASNAVTLVGVIGICFATEWYSRVFGILDRLPIVEYPSTYDRLAQSPIVFGAVVLASAACLYRWRWLSGMYANIKPPTVVIQVLAPSSTFVDSWPVTWAPPAPRVALNWLAYKRIAPSWNLSLVAVFVANIGFLLLDRSLSQNFVLGPFAVLALFVLIGLGSIWTCHGERGGEAESFLAERGLSPSAYWWSRYWWHTVGGTLVFLVLLAFSLILSLLRGERVFTSYSPFEPHLLMLVWIVGIHAYSAACMLAGQTVRNWQFAMFQVGLGTVLLVFMVFIALEASGYPGVLVACSMVLTALPLSWWLSRATLVFWKPAFDWVFPVFSVVVIASVVFATPWVRIWVLPPPANELDFGRALPEFVVPGSIGNDLQPLVGHEVFFPTKSVASTLSSRDTVALKTTAIRSRRRLNELLADAVTVGHKVSRSEISHPMILDARQCFASASEIAVVALELGDAETAELALRLRAIILADVQPVTGIYEFDSLQVEFLETLDRRSSVEAIDVLKELYQKDPSLLPDNTEEFRQIWVKSMEAQLSYLHRNVVKNGAKSATNANHNSAISASDAWFDNMNFTSVRNARFDVLGSLLPAAVWPDLEVERYRREVSADYRMLQDYLQKGHAIEYSSHDREIFVGVLSRRSSFAYQIKNWERQRIAMARLMSRLSQ